MKNIIQNLFIFIFKTISVVFCLIPRKVALLLGKQIGIIIYLLSIRKNVAKKNISIAFEHLSQNQQKTILLNCYKHFGMVLADFLRQQKINKENLDKYFVINKKYQTILNESNGGCMMSAHIGNWEYTLPFMGFNNFSVKTVIKEQSNSAINKFYVKTRTFPNIDLVWKKNSLKKLYEAISNNKFIGLASDQNAGVKGIKIDFFGKKSSFPKGAGIFYSRTNCDILVVFCIMGSDYKYHIYVEKIEMNNADKNEEEIIKEINSLYANILINKIKQYPHQYFWFHKKWSKKIYN